METRNRRRRGFYFSRTFTYWTIFNDKINGQPRALDSVFLVTNNFRPGVFNRDFIFNWLAEEKKNRANHLIIQKSFNVRKKAKKIKDAVIYQATNGAIEVRLDVRKKTIFLTQQQVGVLFNVQKAAISKHIKNIFETGELDKKSTVSILETVQIEGNRNVARKIEYYNLDLILSIGYRVNSSNATKFRQWATKTLRSYIVDGFAIKKSRVAKNYQRFLCVVDEIKQLLPTETAMDAREAVELVSLFTDTWLSLTAYDKDVGLRKIVTKKRVALSAERLMGSLAKLKQELTNKGMATELFGFERNKGNVAGIVGNIMQSFAGQELYQTVEEKAAHLLYFMVKNHPFIDGNKRNGAYAFVWFLRQAKILDVNRFSPVALTAVTILVAESNPQHKEKTIKLILNLISKK